MREMGADSFAFAVRVACQVDGIGGLRRFAKLVDYFDLAGDHLVGRLKDIFGSDLNRLWSWRRPSLWICVFSWVCRSARRAKGFRSSSWEDPSRGRRKPSPCILG